VRLAAGGSPVVVKRRAVNLSRKYISFGVGSIAEIVVLRKYIIV
jgi:hypothetical protein